MILQSLPLLGSHTHALTLSSASYEVAQLFQTLWMHFYSVNPWTLALRTLNLLRPAPTSCVFYSLLCVY